MTARAPLVAGLRGDGLPPDLLGGKGGWLERLVGAGFDVPPAAVLTTECYRAVTADGALCELVTELASAPLPGPVELAESERIVDDAFLSAPLPPSVVAAITEALSVCSAGDPATGYAVRSSATAEDMATMTFAGQYRSFLDMQTEQDVTRAVRLVWASLWHPAPRAYRRYHGVDESSLAMAVVLMPMVAAERAGVAFSVAPGDPQAVRVEVVDGLGDQLVSGEVTPRATLVPRSAAADPPPERGPLEQRVAHLAMRVEAALGAPQDIEWAWADGRLRVLQARPIVSLVALRDDGYDTSTTPTCRWTTAGIAETLPGVLPPLRWETAGLLLEDAFRSHFSSLHIPSDRLGGERLIGRFRGRAALNLGLLEGLASALPGGSPDEVEHQYFGRANHERPATHRTGRTGRLQSARHDLAMLRLRKRASREAETVREAARGVAVAALPLAASSEELYAYRRRLLDLGARSMAAELGVAVSAVVAYRGLEEWLSRRFAQRDAERWAQRLTAHQDRETWWQPVSEGLLGALAGTGLPGEVSWSRAEPRLRLTEEGARFCDALQAAAASAGSMAVFGGECWEEEPELVWDLVRSAAGRPAPAAPGATGRAGGARAWEDFCTALDAAPRRGGVPGQLVDVRLLTVRRLVDDAAELLDRRETTKAAVLAVGGQVRRVQLELGRRLVRSEVLRRPEDIELLGERELADALAGAAPRRADLDRRRRWLYRCGAEEPLPERFEGRPSARRVAGPGGTELHGWAAGPGVHTGPGRVIRSPSEYLDEGAVLVASTTDASWSPLFLRAGAIAVERGGPLSHAAIVARELGMPAVLNVPGLVAAVDSQPGAVRVDGDQGLVVLMGGEPAQTVPDDAPERAGEGARSS